MLIMVLGLALFEIFWGVHVLRPWLYPACSSWGKVFLRPRRPRDSVGHTRQWRWRVRIRARLEELDDPPGVFGEPFAMVCSKAVFGLETWLEKARPLVSDDGKIGVLCGWDDWARWIDTNESRISVYRWRRYSWGGPDRVAALLSCVE